MNKFEYDELVSWQRQRITGLVWKAITEGFKPHNALLSCTPEELRRYQGQAEVIDVLRGYFEIPS